MTRGPYRRAPRRHIEETTHQAGDVIIVGNVRWIITRLHTDARVDLEASNTNPGIIWHTILSNLPTPTKEFS